MASSSSSDGEERRGKKRKHKKEKKHTKAKKRHTSRQRSAPAIPTVAVDDFLSSLRASKLEGVEAALAAYPDIIHTRVAFAESDDAPLSISDAARSWCKSRMGRGG